MRFNHRFLVDPKYASTTRISIAIGILHWDNGAPPRLVNSKLLPFHKGTIHPDEAHSRAGSVGCSPHCTCDAHPMGGEWDGSWSPTLGYWTILIDERGRATHLGSTLYQYQRHDQTPDKRLDSCTSTMSKRINAVLYLAPTEDEGSHRSQLSRGPQTW